ncbi:MAG TPA: YHS domain-containing protein [Planctomycetes bacterium]|nr:YHS domain-containing protein [Planctomycetota bacterium]
MPRLEILSLVSTSITAASQATLDEIATVHLFDTALQPEQLEDLLAVDLITEGVIEFVSSECPVTGKIVDPKYTIVYQGKEILFCCPNCPKIFWEDPSKYLDAK